MTASPPPQATTPPQTTTPQTTTPQTTTPQTTAPGGARLRWAVGDGLSLVGRQITRMRRHPGELVAGLLFPAVMVLLFGYVFGSAIKVPGGGNYREYLMPGLFGMMALMAVTINTLQVATDASKGVMDRFRSMPMSRAAVPLGQAGFDVVLGVEMTVVMMVCGLAVGWRAHEGVMRTLAAFGLIMLLRFAMSWTGIYLGLVVKNEQVADQMVPLIFPVSMISNTFVPTSGMPAWLRAISDWNPVSALVAALRDYFGNPGAAVAHPSWPVAHPVLATVLWSVALTAVFAPLAVREYARRGR
jgi:ABC-2 type transport system permease protein